MPVASRRPLLLQTPFPRSFSPAMWLAIFPKVVAVSSGCPWVSVVWDTAPSWSESVVLARSIICCFIKFRCQGFYCSPVQISVTGQTIILICRWRNSSREWATEWFSSLPPHDIGLWDFTQTISPQTQSFSPSASLLCLNVTHLLVVTLFLTHPRTHSCLYSKGEVDDNIKNLFNRAEPWRTIFLLWLSTLSF